MIPSAEWFVPVPGVGWWPPAWAEVLLIAASSGALGVGLADLTSELSHRLSGGDDEGEEPDGDGGLVEVAGGDEFGDWDGDEMDEWDEGDELDDFGDSGGDSELEPRLDELENEVANISSTIGTVRSENEAINETVEDIEDNIRKLLEIYEMVTRGVNPFVDDVQSSGGVRASFGLFDSDDDEGLDDLDPDVAEADPDSFFDDDFGGDVIDDEEGSDDADFEGDDGLAVDGDLDGVAAGADRLEDSAETTADGTGSDSGKTFDELKSEYESGAADWDAADEPAAGPGGSVPPGGVDSDDGRSSSVDSGGVHRAGSAEPVDSSAETGTGHGPGVAEEADRHQPAAAETTCGGDTSDPKPYLRSLPSGYGAELLVVEWLSSLRSHSSTAETFQAIDYYENVGWIGERAASSLKDYLSGLGDEEVPPATTGVTQLTIDHHTDSLRYIGELGGRHVDVERLEWSRPSHGGNRRERREQRGIQR